jgi:hypothetical protein
MPGKEGAAENELVVTHADALLPRRETGKMAVSNFLVMAGCHPAALHKRVGCRVVPPSSE